MDNSVFQSNVNIRIHFLYKFTFRAFNCYYIILNCNCNTSRYMKW